MDDKLKKSSSDDPLTTCLSLAVKFHKNKIEEDRVLFLKLAEFFLEAKVAWDPLIVERMLISMESKKTSSLIPGKFKHYVGEHGHHPLEFLKSYFRCLIEVFVIFYKNEQTHLIKVVEDELRMLNFLIYSARHRHFNCQKGKKEEHIQWMQNILKNIRLGKGSGLIPYHIGIPGHSFYVMYYAVEGELFAIFHNLGEHSIQSVEEKSSDQLVYPVLYRIKNLDQHLFNVVFAREYRVIMGDKEHPLSDKKKQILMNTIYSQLTLTNAFDHKIWGEKSQETRNCVPKNFFHTMKTRIIMKNGISNEAEMRIGEEIFNTIYLKSFGVLLSYKAHFDGGLGAIDIATTTKSLKENIASLSDKRVSLNLRGKAHAMNHTGSLSTTGVSSRDIWHGEVEKEAKQAGMIVYGASAVATGGFIGSYIKKEDPWWKKLLIRAGAAAGSLLVGELSSRAVEQGIVRYREREDGRQEDQEITLSTVERPVVMDWYAIQPAASPPQILAQESAQEVYHSLGIDIYNPYADAKFLTTSVSFFQPSSSDLYHFDGMPRHQRFNSGYQKHRKEKPDDLKGVPDDFSVHHVIPITYMAFIWDYFYMDFPRLDPTLEAEFEKMATLEVKKYIDQYLSNMEIQHKRRELDPDLRESYERRFSTLSDDEITKKIRTEFRLQRDSCKRDKKKEAKMRIREVMLQLKNQYRATINGDILPTLDALCFSTEEPNKKWFSWSWANLFLGPDGRHRKDDEQDGYIIEGKKPDSFPEDRWKALHSIFEQVTQLINFRRKELQRRSAKVIAVERSLKNELRKLYDVSKHLKEPLRYNKDDWQPIGSHSYSLR